MTLDIYQDVDIHENLVVGSADVNYLSGAGDPEASVTANAGSVYARTDGASGSTFYVKESGSGNTGWRPYAPYLARSGTIIGTSGTAISATTSPTTGGVTLTGQVAAAGSRWKIKAWGNYAAVSSATARNAQIDVVFGGNTITQNSAVAVKTSTSVTTNWMLDYNIEGIDATHVQATYYWHHGITDGSAIDARGRTAVLGASTVVPSGAQTIDLKFSMSNAGPADAWSIVAVDIERIA